MFMTTIIETITEEQITERPEIDFDQIPEHLF